MTTEKMKLKTIPFDVPIPNLDGDAIASTVRIEVQAFTDPGTGEDVLTPESIELIEKTQARHMGLMAADEIKALRLRLALSQDEMSELLQIGAKSYTRWESGRARPSRSMNVTLCALRDGQLGVNYLRALREPVVTVEWRGRSPSHSPLATWFSDRVTKQPEFEFSWSEMIQSAPSEALALWEHLWIDEETIARTEPTAKSAIVGAQIRAYHSMWAADAQSPPSVPRIPSNREQRRTFIASQRHDPPHTEDTISG
jgi:DNA-binding transcriptional regulator YiaG